jgi:ribosomal-protein-alanine N-acetyltransferase
MAIYGPEEFKTRSGRGLLIRHCHLSDVDMFLRFQAQAASETTHTLQVVGRVPERAKLEAAWAVSLKEESGLRVSSFDGDRMVAQLSFQAESHPPLHPWTKHTGRFGMMVLQEFWGQGLGRRLLEIMETHARKIGITRIEAMVRTENSRGVRFYNRMGYQIEGTRRQAALIDGRYQDEFFIAKLLDNPPSWQPPRLETARLVLRPLELRDARAIFAYASNPNVSRYTLWEPHQTVKDSESYILDYALPYYRDETPEPWGIALASEPDKVIGTVGLFWVSKKAKCMELACAIGEPYWGQGLVAEASRAAIDYVFGSLDVIRVQGRCKAENKASARMMEKLGMRHEGTLRSAIFHRDRHWDMHYYAVLRDGS